jgi:hypothetical protein
MAMFIFLQAASKGRNIGKEEFNAIDNKFRAAESWQLEVEAYRGDLPAPPAASLPMPNLQFGGAAPLPLEAPAPEPTMSDACTTEQWNNVSTMATPSTCASQNDCFCSRSLLSWMSLENKSSEIRI